MVAHNRSLLAVLCVRLRTGAARERTLVRWIAGALVCILPAVPRAQTTAAEPSALSASAPAITDIEELSLDDLLNPQSSVSTGTALRSSEAPGVVTVIEREEFLRLGARYLSDVLVWVPGFQTGIDVLGAQGVGFRGQWGFEGKVLLLLDGMELNETLYGTASVNARIPLEHVERIEIIRGPGSAMYGGFAELAVINVISRSGGSFQGARASAHSEWMSRLPHTQQLSLLVGDTSRAQLPDGTPQSEWSALGTFGARHRTETDFVDAAGVLGHDIGFEASGLAQLNVRWGQTRLQLAYEHRALDGSNAYGELATQPLMLTEGGFFSKLSHRFRLARDAVDLTPYVQFKVQSPWRVAGVDHPEHYEKAATRVRTGARLEWRALEGLTLSGGLDGQLDHAWLTSDALTGLQTQFAGKNTATFGNAAADVQLVYLNPIVNVSGGLRGEWHSAFGPSVVPRVALTRAFWLMYAKLMFSQSFRAPTIENLAVNAAIKPERTNVLEAEIGITPTPGLRLAVNGFWGRINQPIVYETDAATSTDSYINQSHTGSAGVEFEVQAQTSWLRARANYSFYTAMNQNAVALYNVTDPALVAGMAAHKVGWAATALILGERLHASVSGQVLSRREATVGQVNRIAELGTLPPFVQLDLSAGSRNIAGTGVDLLLGVSNIVGEPLAIAQPHSGGHPPLFGPGRSVFLRASYSLDAPSAQP